jgi:hypothetical protein
VKKVRITLCTLATANFFTRIGSEVLGNDINTKSRKAKVTVKKRPKRAGATPLFGGGSAQKFPGVTPALFIL